jgi:hypothetical protein
LNRRLQFPGTLGSHNDLPAEMRLENLAGKSVRSFSAAP